MKSPFSIEYLTGVPRLGMGQYGIKATLNGKIAWTLVWFENSWLLRSIMVQPFSCACFGICGQRITHLKDKEDVCWQPHNIDHPDQAFKLAAVWLRWLNGISHIEVKNGKTLIEWPWAS